MNHYLVRRSREGLEDTKVSDSFEEYLSKRTISSKGPEDVIKSRPATSREQVSDIVDYLKSFAFSEEPTKSLSGQRGKESGDITRDILGLAMLLGASRDVSRGYRVFRKDYLKELEGAVKNLPEDVRHLRSYTKKFMEGPFFHGTSEKAAEKIMKEGFSSKGISKIGEPAGVSLTRLPSVARTFSNIGDTSGVTLRVAPVVHPDLIYPAFSKTAGEKLLSSYRESMKIPFRSPEDLSQISPFTHKAPQLEGSFEESIPQLYEALNKHYRNKYAEPLSPQHFFSFLNSTLSTDFRQRFSESLAKSLQRSEIEGLIYNPKRFYEYEMRLFDPKKAVPLESRSPYDPAYERYNPRASRAIESLEDFSSTLPVHLKDFYRNLDITRALEGR